MPKVFHTFTSSSASAAATSWDHDTGNVMSWFGNVLICKIFFPVLVYEVKKRYFLINPGGFEVSGSPAPINCYMNKTSEVETSYKTMKTSFPDFAEVSIQKLNLTTIFRRNNRFLFFSQMSQSSIRLQRLPRGLSSKKPQTAYVS